eukprot:scaffold703_cov285-Prasinococcus_capsulatus_cf.AAC.1
MAPLAFADWPAQLARLKGIQAASAEDVARLHDYDIKYTDDFRDDGRVSSAPRGLATSCDAVVVLAATSARPPPPSSPPLPRVAGCKENQPAVGASLPLTPRRGRARATCGRGVRGRARRGRGPRVPAEPERAPARTATIMTVMMVHPRSR